MDEEYAGWSLLLPVRRSEEAVEQCPPGKADAEQDVRFLALSLRSSLSSGDGSLVSFVKKQQEVGRSHGVSKLAQQRDHLPAMIGGVVHDVGKLLPERIGAGLPSKIR